MVTLPSLQQMRFLCAVAEHRHFGRAADSCAVTQSTLSAGIQEMEERLGVTLVERDRRRVMMTPLGEEIVVRAGRLLSDAEDLVDVAHGGREPLSGSLRLGVIPTIGPYLAPPVMRGLAKAFPKLKLYLREEQTASILEKLAVGQLDLVLMALPYDVGDLETMMLGEDAILVALPVDHRLAGAKRIDHDDLAAEKLLLLEDGHCLRSHSLQACRIAGSVANEIFQGTSLRTLVQMAASGLGVTLVPEMALAAELPADSILVARPLGHGTSSRTIALAWRRNSARKSEFRVFGGYVRDILSELRRTAGISRQPSGALQEAR
jgi:LysR family hydrogen peroxide-inducible transcriptional activator